ncbi:MAG: rRNA maturation RNase YbeY [Clostridia bacterium]|nr:rRNA maturation RNase YbeY [Clostridia bacterium]
MTLEIVGELNKECENAVNMAFFGVLEYIGQTDDVYVELSIVSPEEIQDINRETRSIDRVTDVLSFPTVDGKRAKISVDDCPFDVDPESGEIVLGELVLCLERAKEQAEEYGHSLVRELAFLVTHGTLHLFGFDHIEKADEEEMFPLQNKILEKIGITR